MKWKLSREQIFLYLWMSLGYLAIRVLHEATSGSEDVFTRTVNITWRLPFFTLVNFIYFEKVLPYVIRKRKYLIYNLVLFLVSFWTLFMVYAFGGYIWRAIGIQLHIYTPLKEFTWEEAMTASAGFGFGSLIFFGIISHTYNYFKLRTAAQQLRLEKQEAELNFLKSQTNPHFLFNTLNNIYSLTKYRSEQAPESILRLSKILRFMLYEANGPFIPVEKELAIISDYIDLEKLRYDENLRINFSHDIEDMKQAIPPLLLMPFVENAFKHGVSESRGDRFVDIHLSIHQRRLTFTVKNSSETIVTEPLKENIGLANLRRQLELLYTDYDLQVSQDKNVFIAILKINLSSYVKNQLHHR